MVSDAPAGRVLSLATTLDVGYDPQVARETRVVRASEVLALAGPRGADRVVAQLNLG